MKPLLHLISKVHDKGTRFIIEALKKNGADSLSASHGDILMCLYKYEKMTMKDIADKIQRTKPTVTVLIDKLEKMGYLKRTPSSEDNRSTYIVLTQKGKDFKPVFDNISKELNEMLYKNLSEEDANTLENLLKKVLK